ncbi:MAG: class I SAM-dependent methyltransferase [Novosphingobium sp.]|nr:class I SAM-dependent methyltransferase [Novosphingobium sp.]
MEGIRLNLGSGRAKLEGYINIDNREEMEPDIVCSITSLPFDDNSVDYIRAYDVLEHIPAGKDAVKAIEEIYRVLVPGGIFESSTPDCEFGMAAFQDPFHISFWCENTWKYFSDPISRELYGIKAFFRYDLLERAPPFHPGNRMYWLHVIAAAIKETEITEEEAEKIIEGEGD